MITFILNNTEVRTTSLQGTPLLDVIRREYKLKGTKLACGEGECGACTVLIGSLTGEKVEYLSVTSCITPLAYVQGKHVVTIEGLAFPVPGLIQKALIACNGTQCGFCTPGFVVAMTGGILNNTDVTSEKLIAAMDGNICRCTGYKSIERAAEEVANELIHVRVHQSQHVEPNPGIVPEYFQTIAARLKVIRREEKTMPGSSTQFIGGGTDLYVQKPYSMLTAQLFSLSSDEELKGISHESGRICVGAGETLSGIQNSELLWQVIPGMHTYLAPVASTQIRNTATLGGNLVNASPIGDMIIFFLGLDADVVLWDFRNEQTIKLRDLYLGYKTLAKSPEIIIKRIEFEMPLGGKFHFERVCKRSYLDVASVNSACLLQCDEENVIKRIHLSAGGVAPIPRYLHRTVEYMLGKKITVSLIREAQEIVQEEISPIDDIRGTATYKRLLMRQLFFIHMTKLAPVPIDMEALIQK